MAIPSQLLRAVSAYATTDRRWRVGLLIGLSILVLGAVVLSPAIPQPLGYHDFADQRSLAGVPHFWNVVSNLPFAFIGLAGCVWLLRNARRLSVYGGRSRWAAYFVFFFGEFLTCFGSAYYHADPSNGTLVWDRLVFSLLLTSFLTIVVAELVSRCAARILLVPMVLIGLFSVVQWHWTELAGVGDLRLYLLVQFYPVLAIPIIIALFGAGSTAARAFLLTWALYGAAKICEVLDVPLYAFTGSWSGHTFKHFVAATATGCVLYFLAAQRLRVPRLAAVPLQQEAI